MAAWLHRLRPLALADPRIRARALRLGGLTLAVLAIHAGLLGVAPQGAGADRMRAGGRVVEARRIELPAAKPVAPAARPAALAATPARVVPRPGPKSAPPAAPMPHHAMAPAPEPEPAAAQAPEPDVAVDPPQGAVGAAEAVSVAEVAPSAPAAGGIEVPVYATRIPEAASLNYALRRGTQVGNGGLHWRHDGQRYELLLEGAIIGRPLLEQFSRGGFDGAGLAPLRFADRRRGRDLRATNFQREAGKISFSAATHEFPLVGGAQDRLSWMAQLAAITAADPGRWRAGERISIFVAGSRGDADVWTFVVQGEEVVDLPAGPTPALRLLRESRRRYDPQWDIWLSARHGGWPVRAVQTMQPSGETVELLLIDGPNPYSR